MDWFDLLSFLKNFGLSGHVDRSVRFRPLTLIPVSALSSVLPNFFFLAVGDTDSDSSGP
jgi:hypothetical protein